MDIALCLSQLTSYITKESEQQGKVKNLEHQVEAEIETGGKASTTLLKQLNAAKLLLGMYSEFINFWKGQIEAFKSLHKSLGELANAAR